MSRKIKMPAETSTYYPYNANPSGKRTGDCVIRAFSYALNITWDQVLDELVQMSHNLKYAPLSVENYDRVLVRHGWIKQKMPKKLDNRRYRGNEFCEYPEGYDHQCGLGCSENQRGLCRLCELRRKWD